MNDSSSLPRISRLTEAEFYAGYLSRSQPVVVTDDMSAWDAPTTWDLDLLEQYGERRVQVEHYPSGRRCDVFAFREMSLSEYIRLIRNSPVQRNSYYLAERPVERLLPSVPQTPGAPSLADLDRPSFVREGEKFRCMIFAGIDTFSTAHYHTGSTQAILCQIEGSKTVRLIPPSSMKHMYLAKWYSVRANHSRVPFTAGESPDFARFPRLKDAEVVECVLQPGEMLFIPDHWIHIVEGSGPNISATYFWDSALRYANFKGVARDTASSIAKQALLAGAALSCRFGANKFLVDLACNLRIANQEDKEAILLHLNQFGAKRPHKATAN